jgi:hypothetical protein
LTKPSISGTPALGQTLTCDNGSWTNSPTNFTSQWNRDGTPITGATSQTYVVQTADQGHTLTCTVIAANAGGSSQPTTGAGSMVPAAAAAAAAAHCTVSSSGKVTITRPKRHNKRSGKSKPSVATGTVSVRIICDTGAAAKITARLTDARHGHKTKRYNLATVNTPLVDGTTTVKLKLPASAINDLIDGARESVTIALSATSVGGTAHSTVTVSPIHT